MEELEERNYFCDEGLVLNMQILIIENGGMILTRRICESDFPRLLSSSLTSGSSVWL